MDTVAALLCGTDRFQLFYYELNTTVPHISECARITILSFIPCIFLFMFCPLVLYRLSKSENDSIEFCSPILVRIVLCIFLLLDTAFLFFYGLYELISGSRGISVYVLVLPLLQYLALCGALVLMIACRNRGLVTSGVLFNFWLLLCVCGFPEFRWMVESAFSFQEYDVDVIRLVLFMIYYPIILLELILSCFADTPRFKIHNDKICPEEQCSFFNQITFHWFHGMAVKGYKHALQTSDLWNLNLRDQSQSLVPEFNKYWRPSLQAYFERKRSAAKSDLQQDSGGSDLPSIIWPIVKTYRLTFLGGAVLKFIFDLLQFVAPQLLSSLISFIEDRHSPTWIGICIAFMMFFVALLQSFILHQYFHSMFTLGMNIRSVLTSTVYSKALSLSNAARRIRTVGEIVNLMSVDIQRIQDMTTFIMLFWSAPLQVSLAIYFLWRLLGVSVIAGLFILIAMVPFNSWVSVQMKNCQVEQMKYKDQRLKLMSEILNGIKVLKLYAWEESMQSMVFDIRLKEIKVLKKLAIYNAVTTLSWSCAPFLVAVLTFGVYVNIDPENNILTPQVTFVALSLFNILRFPLAIFAMILSQAIQCVVSNKRLKTFLAEDEMSNFITDGNAKRGTVAIEDGNFSWDGNEITLKNINMHVKKSSLVAVVGRVGSGKSSLISALLGEMNKISGKVTVSGSVAYVPQQAWIQNMSLQANIIFNKAFIPTFYKTVLDACALLPDLASLPAGDKTEIGEKGINLSGGQKQRVSLARAVYSDRDIVLLDDPLSAVDAHVGKHIFERVIASSSGVLAGKTRILVTNGLHFLKHCDLVIMMEGGTIAQIGTYEDLMRSEGDFARFLEEYLIEETKNRTRSTGSEQDDEPVEIVLEELEKFDPVKRRRIQSQLSQTARSSAESLHRTESPKSPEEFDLTVTGFSDSSLSTRCGTIDNATASSEEKQNLLQTTKDGHSPNKSALIEKETMEIGKVKWSVYMSYLRAIGYSSTVLFFSIYVFASVLGVLSNLWLADWSDRAKFRNASSSEDDTNMRLFIYASLGLGQAVFICAASVTMAMGMVHASRALHEAILSNILHSPMAFFDVTPLGRILNRFGKDVDVVDTNLPSSSRSFIATFLNVFVTAFVIIYATPAFSAVLPLLGLIYFVVLRFYVSTSRQLKRLESTTRSPIYSHFQESVQGAASIRAYHCVDNFIRESQIKVDDNLITYYPSIVANRWLAVRLELVGNIIVLCSALFAALYRDGGTVTAGLVGLSVSYALNITQTLNWAVRMTSELETNIVAVERIKEYAETPTEGTDHENLLQKAPLDWPSKGEIHIENLHLRYRKNLDLVLHGVDAVIKPNEKVGIVGRTGAGKSSLILALFRIIEADEGRILIDGQDISKLPLQQLRSRLTIVPQDPVLFSGTLRANLDPFDRFNDAKLWEALDQAHLETFVSSLPEKLEHVITEGGENLSVGQRQLVCLVRALLRKTKILMLDEAAASVDLETDSLIQKTIRDQFADCTVLTIAHRLNTVIDSERLLVLDNGRVAEFDTPSNLLANKESLFYSMAKDASLVH